jgi:hypothetical protein
MALGRFRMELDYGCVDTRTHHRVSVDDVVLTLSEHKHHGCMCKHVTPLELN